MSGQGEFKYIWGGASALGGRNEQQDRWSVFPDPAGKGLLAVVADGMGGHRDGALAAEMVMTATSSYLKSGRAKLAERPKEALSELCEESQAAIVARSHAAHSTAVFLWLNKQRAYWAHVGDSRCYHFRDGQRLMRTRDHSAVQLLVDIGEITEEEMATHPNQNRLFRSLGGQEAPKPDFGDSLVETDDVFALCSDGLWEHVSDEELWTRGSAPKPDQQVKQLVELAVNRGGPRTDNATLVLVRPVQHISWLRRLFGWQ